MNETLQKPPLTPKNLAAIERFQNAYALTKLDVPENPKALRAHFDKILQATGIAMPKRVRLVNEADRGTHFEERVTNLQRAISAAAVELYKRIG